MSINTHLGQKSEYKSLYDASLLVKELRQSNRDYLNIKGDDLPFIGYDTWNGYEVTALTDDGLPVSGVVKIVYNCNSDYIVESKSLKLYFNSFSMTKMGKHAESVLENIEKSAVKDLSALLNTKVNVRAFLNTEMLEASREYSALEEWHEIYGMDEIITIEEEYPVEGVQFTAYNEDPTLLRVLDAEVDSVRYHSSLLRSRCKVTAQPDSGDVYIYIKGPKTVDPISLLQYIVSFRDECHFHEEICEAIYKRLWDLLEPEDLCVKCLYARRGGWDINPERASDKVLLHVSLSDVDMPHIKIPRQ